MITGRQVKAARALLDMRQDELAELIGLTVQAVRKIEAEAVQPREGTVGDILTVFTTRGIEFTENEGVRRSPEGIRVMQGPSGFLEFYDIIYDHLSQHGGDVCIGGSDSSLYTQYRPNPEAHRERMAQLAKARKDLRVRILVKEGDTNFVASNYASYRWQAKEYFSPTTFYTFGDYLALISFFHRPAPHVILIKSKPYADAYRLAFEAAWAMAKEPSAP